MLKLLNCDEQYSMLLHIVILWNLLIRKKKLLSGVRYLEKTVELDNLSDKKDKI